MMKRMCQSYLTYVGILAVCLCLGISGCGQHPQLIETDADPGSLALDARGRYLYIACEGAEKVIAWNLKTHTRMSMAEVETGPLRLYLEKDNRTLRVLCQTDQIMLTYSVPEMKLIETFKLPDGPTALLTRVDKHQMIFCSTDSNLIRPYIGKNPLPVIEVGLAPTDLLLQPDTDLLWAAIFKANELAVVNMEKNVVVKRVPVWANPQRLTISPLGDELFVLCTGKDAVPTQSVVQLVDCFYQSAGLTWKAGKNARDFVLGPKGRNLYIIDETKLRILSARTGVKLFETRTGRDPQAIVVSPDGSRVYVSCREEQAVYIHEFKER